MILDKIRTESKNPLRVNFNRFTQPYKTDAGVSCIRRDSIAAFTTTSDEITVHLYSGTIFTIPLAQNETDMENITADLVGIIPESEKVDA